MRWLAFLTLIAGCGPGSFDEFRDQYVSRLCDNARHCGAIGRLDPCPLPDSIPAAGDLDVPSGIADGRLGFDSKHAQECLDALDNPPCDPAIVAIRIYEHCHHVVGPKLATGEPCHVGDECVGGTCDGTFSCPGHCVAWPAPHSPCQPGGCDPTVQFCGGEPPTCQPHSGEGGPCTADDQCAWPFVCASDQCAHHRRVGDGRECGFPDAVCDDQRYCSPSTGLCAGLHPRGAPCDARQGCVRDTGCPPGDGGTCLGWSDEGLPCSDGLCPLSQTCVSGGGNPDAGLWGTCRADPLLPAGPHESCEKRPCQPGLYCTDRNRRCEYVRRLGGHCAESDPGCMAGLICDQGRCRPPPTDCTSPDGGATD